jgi:hypothetical protein
VENSASGSGEGPGWATAPVYSTGGFQDILPGSRGACNPNSFTIWPIPGRSGSAPGIMARAEDQE